MFLSLKLCTKIKKVFKFILFKHTFKRVLTSAPIKAHMLMPLKSPNMIETIIMIPDIVKIEESNAIRRKCDQPGVVGENDSCKKIKRRF